MTGKIADDIMELEKRADAVSASGTHHDMELQACSRCQHHISLYEDLADHMLELYVTDLTFLPNVRGSIASQTWHRDHGRRRLL